MSQETTRSVFDSLIYKSHVANALVQRDGQYNDIPTSLATIVHLHGTPSQLRTMYESRKPHLHSWTVSPDRIVTVDHRAEHMGDVRFQRAYMDYYSMENGKLGGNSTILALSHLVSGPKPLMYGLFGAFGRSLLFLSDGIELQSAVVVVESLVLASVDWSPPLYDLLRDAQLDAAPDELLLSPEALLGRMAYDGRFSGVVKSGPGFDGVSTVLVNDAARAAVLEYVCRLDLRCPAALVAQLARLSALLLCATHKPGRPAFDFYLAALPALVNSLRLLLCACPDRRSDAVLLRGLWTLVVLAYVTQLRPAVDPSLVPSDGLHEECESAWERVFSEFRDGDDDSPLEDKHLDPHFLRALRSLRELHVAFGDGEHVYIAAAWKLRSQWRRWTGVGADREETLNIRL